MTEPFGVAHVQYDHFLGTAAADEPNELGALYRVAQLDREAWWILGLDIAGGEGDHAAVLAISRDRAHGFDELHDLAQQNGGELPVRRFELPPSGDQEWVSGVELLTLLKRWSIHFKLEHLNAIELMVDTE